MRIEEARHEEEKEVVKLQRTYEKEVRFDLDSDDDDNRDESSSSLGDRVLTPPKTITSSPALPNNE